MEVHPPHQTIHTWRDFFIHMGTICLGLLIAIGLEQLVELMHHRHQCHELQEAMRAEAEQNLEVVKVDSEDVMRALTNLSNIHASLNNATTKGDTVTFVVPAYRTSSPGFYFRTPTRATWAVAVAAGEVALLPSEQAKAYGRLDFSTAFAADAERTYFDRYDTLLTEIQLLHLDHSPQGSNVTLSTANFEKLSRACLDTQTATHELMQALALDRGALQATVDGVQGLSEMYDYQQRAMHENEAAVKQFGRVTP